MNRLFLSLPLAALLAAAAHADIYSDLGAAHNTGAAPAGVAAIAVSGYEETGVSTNPNANYSYTLGNDPSAGYLGDFKWIHETNAGGQTPNVANGTQWTFAGASNSYLLLPSIDHTPLPNEGVEATLWGLSASGGWIKGTLVEIYDQGFDTNAIVDDYASRWVFSEAVTKVAATWGLYQGSYGYGDGDVEIDAVMQFNSVVPAPAAAALSVLGMACTRWVRRKA